MPMSTMVRHHLSIGLGLHVGKLIKQLTAPSITERGCIYNF